MQAATDSIPLGIDLVPGGAEGTAAARAVEAVKSFTENALDIADSMGSWVGSACGIQDPDWPNSIFDVLGASPDSYGTSIGCKKKNKADCQKVDAIPDKPKTKSPDDLVTNEPHTGSATASELLFIVPWDARLPLSDLLQTTCYILCYFKIQHQVLVFDIWTSLTYVL